ncbi:type II secretion system protein [Frigoriglobus tundricola]|uniref:Type II secretion system protein GspG C-terminal domain-containing protein n=1 Tax=Frigoriglobus tundricola TaxID=2774151 RepID=A0A6M5YHI8_9BACT|nr:hypothetical protein [Frigoriglobus tundricola]QJW93428.1 hypothetical protein FTUN_0934 [Frigoriglobus tundricola]
MNALALPLLLFVASADEKPPAPKLPLGKDTTYVVGPLDKHGYIDYEAALNAEMSKGVNPNKNANVLLVQSFGPAPEGGDGMPAEYFKWLDVPAPPKDGDYFLGIYKVAHDKLGLTQEQMEALYEFMGRANQRPWAAKDCVPLAEWLKINERPLATAIEATKRPEYFNPLTSRRSEGESSNLIGALLPTVQKCREIASALTCRAMLKLGEKKYDDAWADIYACHRLGRLLTRGATLIETLVGIAISQIATNATLAYLDRADLSAKQTLERLKELHALPPVAALADKIGTGERMMGLDGLQLVRRGGHLERPNVKPTPEELKALEKIDWVPAMQALNAHYDRTAAAMRIKDRAAREKEFDVIEKELDERVKVGRTLESLQKLISDAGEGKVTGKKIGDVLVALLAPGVRKIQQAHDRVTQVERNLHVAFALAAYRKDNGAYPTKLADLAPAYLAAVPDDLFANQPIIYKPDAKGYLLYSVGPNGRDDGGRWYNDDPPGDDPNVRMPLPELKKK